MLVVLRFMENETLPTFRSLVAEAVKLVGSQTELAKRMERSQQQVSFLCTVAKKISAEDSIAIERATGGQIPRWRLRPDLWSQPLPEVAA